MFTIRKHGTLYKKRYAVHCPICECEFTGTIEDGRIEVIGENGSPDAVSFVCPECSMRTVVEGQ